MASGGRDEILGKECAYANSTACDFAKLITQNNDAWAEAVSKATGRSKEKLLSALEWGKKELKGVMSETALKALTTIAADEKGELL